jgi:hypothetical protein
MGDLLASEAMTRYLAGAFSAGAGPVDGPAGPTFGAGAGLVADGSPQPRGAQRAIKKRQSVARIRILFRLIIPPTLEDAGSIQKKILQNLGPT